MRLERFHVEHLDTFCVQPMQQWEAAGLEMLEKSRFDLTSCMHLGNVYCIAGLLEVTKDRAVGISYMSADSGKYLRSIAGLLTAWMDSYHYRRIEITVQRGWDNGMRWANLLGFELEGIMRSYYPNGEDAYLYGRVTQ